MLGQSLGLEPEAASPAHILEGNWGQLMPICASVWGLAVPLSVPPCNHPSTVSLLPSAQNSYPSDANIQAPKILGSLPIPCPLGKHIRDPTSPEQTSNPALSSYFVLFSVC